MTKIVCLWIQNKLYGPVKEACFKVCECGCGRCSIFFKIGHVDPNALKNKEQALDALAGLERKEYVNHKEALKIKLERLNKEKENPTPAETAFENASGSSPSKKSVEDMNAQELKDFEAKLKSEYNQKHK